MVSWAPTLHDIFTEQVGRGGERESWGSIGTPQGHLLGHWILIFIISIDTSGGHLRPLVNGAEASGRMRRWGWGHLYSHL